MFEWISTLLDPELLVLGSGRAECGTERVEATW